MLPLACTSRTRHTRTYAPSIHQKIGQKRKPTLSKLALSIIPPEIDQLQKASLKKRSSKIVVADPSSPFLKSSCLVDSLAKIRKIEGAAKLQFGPKSTLASSDLGFLQTAYTQSHMIDLQKTEPTLQPADVDSKASF